MEEDPDVERLLTTYCRMCTEVGIESLPPDQARESAKTLKRVLIPAFDATFQQH